MCCGGRVPVRCLKGNDVVDQTTRAALAAVAAIEDDEESEVEPTAEAVADRAGVAVNVASRELDRLNRDGLILDRARAYFPSSQAGPSAGSRSYAVTDPGRKRLVDG